MVYFYALKPEEILVRVISVSLSVHGPYSIIMLWQRQRVHVTLSVNDFVIYCIAQLCCEYLPLYFVKESYRFWSRCSRVTWSNYDKFILPPPHPALPCLHSHYDIPVGNTTSYWQITYLLLQEYHKKTKQNLHIIIKYHNSKYRPIVSVMVFPLT